MAFCTVRHQRSLYMSVLTTNHQNNDPKHTKLQKVSDKYLTAKTTYCTILKMRNGALCICFWPEISDVERSNLASLSVEKTAQIPKKSFHDIPYVSFSALM